MVKLIGPSQSIRASGTLADAITFSQWQKRAYLRKRVKPKNPQSTAQVQQRSMVAFLAEQWATWTTTEHDTWNDLATKQNLPPYQAYLKYNLDRWAIGKAPSNVYPAAEDDTPQAITSITDDVINQMVTVKIFGSTLNNGWGIAIQRDTAAMTKETINRTIQVLRSQAPGWREYIDGPLTPDTYWWRPRAFSFHGVWDTAFNGQMSRTVT